MVEESHQTDSFSCTYKLQFPAFFNIGDTYIVTSSDQWSLDSSQDDYL